MAPRLVIPAMAAALVARFDLIWVTVAGGVALGVAESVLQRYNVNAGIITSVPFAVIIVAVVRGGTALPGRCESLSIRLPRLGNGRIKPARLVVLVGVAVAIPLLFSPTWATAMINSTVFRLLALSIMVVDRICGSDQRRVGCARRFRILHRRPLQQRLASAVRCVHPHRRRSRRRARRADRWSSGAVRGINLAIVPLGLSFAVENMVLLEPALTGQTVGLQVHDASLFGLDLNPASHPARFAIFCVLVVTLGALAVLNIRRGESGRRYVAVRANGVRPPPESSCPVPSWGPSRSPRPGGPVRCAGHFPVLRGRLLRVRRVPVDIRAGFHRRG